jgi:hypothetical protein
MATKREESPIGKRQHLRDPNGRTRTCSGATVGDNHKGPLTTRGEAHLLLEKQNTNEFTNLKTRSKLGVGIFFTENRSSNRTETEPKCRFFGFGFSFMFCLVRCSVSVSVFRVHRTEQPIEPKLYSVAFLPQAIHNRATATHHMQAKKHA